ncbi:hypothetical protein [Methylobacterium platani]|uniref:HEPN domain-containing protein n=2 Tax=Methylobacterium platani TaxID=427683 RepID=A0A179SAW5_9HYPH|nr:hypothetical protein [Methylobacterium platani]KMO15158.1 hypothetical protein SQ03_17640 [Methylobacterium platani JCM 14648]OAS23290.1 hypothetical protein A5481_16590 [Methylobacterium platani]
MLDIAHLLEQAERLAEATDGIDRPRPTDLRRAVSAAYYAVFHAGLIAAADAFSGKADRESAAYGLVYRSVDHAKMKALCQEIIKQKPSTKFQKYRPTEGWDPFLVGYSEAFITLKEQRMLADYDPGYRIAPAEVEVYISTARSAVDRLDSANGASKRVFLMLLLFPPR